MIEAEIHPTVQTFTAMISIFSYEGNLKNVSLLYDEMKKSGVQPNSRTLGAIMYGLAKTKKIGPALELYDWMRKEVSTDRRLPSM